MSGPVVRKTRAERFGALVATESPAALVSVDRVLARRLGVEGGVLWSDPAPRARVDVLSGPTEVHVAVTERCPAACTGCYADASPEGEEPPLDVLLARLDQVAALGAFSKVRRDDVAADRPHAALGTVAFGGGEGALREDLPAAVAHARAIGLVPTLTTSGLGITPARARALRGLAQVNVSYDGPPGVYEAVRGYRGAVAAERAMAALREAGVPVGMNTVLTRASAAHLEATAERAEQLGVVELQLLRFKPSGRGKLDYLATRLTPEQVSTLPARLRAISARHAFALRVDCAMVPFFAGDPEVSAEALARFGVIGCEPGRSLATVDVRGDVRACSFWRDRPAEPLTPSTWEADATLGEFRRFAASLPEPCATCELASVCRGGCRIVAGALTGEDFSPDPECPRVRASRAEPRP